MRSLLCDRALVFIEEVPNARVSSNQDELLRRWNLPKFFEQLEQPLYRNIHHIKRNFFACGQMNDVSDISHRNFANRPISDRPFDNIQT